MKSVLMTLNILGVCAAKGNIEYIRGKLSVTLNGVTYNAFEGVRYASAPVEKYSFEEPIAEYELKSNLGRKVDCLQIDPENGKSIGEDDCLFLNVYTPSPMTERAPVMVWIHGTPFPLGTSQSSLYEPELFMEQGVVVVTLSYRLDVLGFASYETSKMPGNYGLQDQELAIKWVLKNIQFFGGDPDRITLAGHGSGAAHVLFHLNGRMAGKIERGIALSGSRFAPWALSVGSWTSKQTHSLASWMKDRKLSPCPTFTPNCLKKANATTMIDWSFKTITSLPMLWDRLTWPFRPVVDQVYIKSYPWSSNSSGNFSLLLGLNRDEGDIMNIFADVRNWMVKDRETLFDTFIAVHHPARLNLDVDLQSRINALYEGTRIWKNQLNQLATDGWFFYPAVEEARSHAGPLQAFMFDFQSDFAHMGCSVRRRTNVAAHGDELPFIFNISACRYTLANRRTAKKYVDTLASFVRNGKASLKRYSDDKELFDITAALSNPEVFGTFDKSIAKRMRFWKDLGLYSK
ncbi:cholinesterase 1-like [Cimex lectularius]|uniref:Carboxylesterase type B domain-containing protein n=1 Tax=Cimex lectularius TaxID=79782 RepID=A0A8I6S6K0_CIMLE|nr:cholinesterase 1-like [Cimex lectularius]